MIRFYILGIALILASCCDSKIYKESKFRPEQVSCEDISSQELRDKVESIIKRRGGDLYYTSFIEYMLADIRVLADHGNVKGMYLYGAFVFEAVALMGSKLEMYPLPKHYKDEVVRGLTYSYISYSISSDDKEIRTLLGRIGSYVSSSYIPTSWDNEARYNAEKWKKRCIKY